MIRWKCTFLAVAIGFITSGAAQASIALEFTSGTSYTLVGTDGSVGWYFTTNQAITVTALDAYDPSNGSGNVRLYDVAGNILASATVTTSDPLVGSPVSFRSHAITPVSLSANTTYYIAQDARGNAFFGSVGGMTTISAITYGGQVAGGGLGQTPTGDGFGGAFSPGFFGPNFEIADQNVVPEPSSLTVFSILGLLGYVGLRRERRFSVIGK